MSPSTKNAFTVLKVPPNYQVQRRATAALARGRDSDRVRTDAERPRHALYVSPVRCNAELGAEHGIWIEAPKDQAEV